MWARQNNTDGFTQFELLIVIVLIGIMVALVTFIPQNLIKTSNAKHQAGDIASIARRLEAAYTAQEIGSPSYPSTVELASDISGSTRTMSRTDPEIFRVPGASSSSVTAATVNTTTNPAGTNTPTTSQYVYQPLLATGALCTASSSSASTATQCVRYNLYYRSLNDNTIYQIKSQRQQ